MAGYKRKRTRTGKELFAATCAGLRLGASQTAFHKALLLALPAAALAAGMKYTEQRWGVEYKMAEDNTYQSFTFLLGIFIVFHTSHAYQRLMRGAESLYTIVGDLVDLSSLLLAFTRTSSANVDQIHQFRFSIVSLMSLLFSVSSAELEEGEHEDRRAHEFPLLDIGGLEATMLRRVAADEHKAEVVCHVTQGLIVDSIATGVLTIPAPLLTRAFQELGAAMIKFHEVRAYREVAFPFPLKAASTFLLLIHWLITPWFMSHWTMTPSGAAGYTFLSVFTLWTLHCVAVELDNPFGLDVNDLSMRSMQEDLNSRLTSLLFESVADSELSPNFRRSMEKYRSGGRKSSFKELYDRAKSGLSTSTSRIMSECSSPGGESPASMQHEAVAAKTPRESTATTAMCEDCQTAPSAGGSEVPFDAEPQVAEHALEAPIVPDAGRRVSCYASPPGGRALAAADAREQSATSVLPSSPRSRAMAQRLHGRTLPTVGAPPSAALPVAAAAAEQSAAADVMVGSASHAIGHRAPLTKREPSAASPVTQGAGVGIVGSSLATARAPLRFREFSEATPAAQWLHRMPSDEPV